MSKSIRDKITGYISEQYGVDAEFPWENDAVSCVFRHRENKKWFALIMEVRRETLGLKGKSSVPVMNLKIDDIVLRDMVLQEEGILPAYHMNKQHWITVLLDGTVSEDRVKDLLDISFQATAPGRRKRKERPAKSWIIPANPKYYDVESAFAKEEIIDWKQGSGINTGDTVYMYVGAPVSAILYKCKVLETDIPYNYEDKNLTIKALMKIKLLRRYDRKKFTFSVLNDEFGIYAIRGPRTVTHSLKCALEEKE
ncbi:MAG: MmcQ/YjbR family DNA-binding protein [Clostridiales bacterium]|nr:MmcQ/YjbR family DNA-binding protein [Clostridiales bacterium]